MKKLIFSAAVMASAFFAASCQQEMLDPQAEGTTVTYTVEVPGALATKAADGFELIYEVFYPIKKLLNLNHIEELVNYLRVKTEPCYFEITSIPQLTVPQVANSLISVAPLPEQKAIAEVLSDMDAEIEALEAKRMKYKSIKQGMMQQLLTGKIRLV